MNPDLLLTENQDVLVAALIEKHLPQPVTVSWDEVTRSQVIEVSLQVQDPFERGANYTVAGSKVILTFPLTGTSDMLAYRASTYSYSSMRGEVSGNAIVLEVADRTLTAEVVQSRIDQLRQDIDKRAGWANEDLRRFTEVAKEELKSLYLSRKERILHDREVEEALGIPVRSSDARRQPVPACRKQVALETRRAQAEFVPEPELAEAIYREVLDVVQSWARSLERTPKTSNKLDEEELRDLLLGTLNGYWSGAAGGELFNGSGKTDILIRFNNRNVFIAECKIWRGRKTASEAIGQLLSYLVWRDTKAAIVMFIKTADPAVTMERLHAAVESHPQYVLTKDSTEPQKQVDYVFTADTEGRRISLAIIPVIVRP